MKRSREDDVSGDDYRAKPPVVTEVTGSGRQQNVSGGSGNKWMTTDALTYLKEVKDTFHNDKQKYLEFLDVMYDFKALRIDTAGVIARVKKHFKGNWTLTLGFNAFLPTGYEISLTKEEALSEAVQLVQKIKKRFQGDDHVFKSFRDILRSYRKENKSEHEIHKEVAALFRDHPDLLKDITNFLPLSIESAASNQSVKSSKNHKPSHEERSAPVGAVRPLHSEKKRKAERDISVDMPDKEHIGHGKTETERGEEREHRSQDRDSDRHKRKFTSSLEDSVTELFHQDMRDQVLCLREKVKGRVSKLDEYQAFLKCIVEYRTENITRSQLQSLVNNLLGAYPDLMEEVDGFIDRSEKTGTGNNTRWGRVYQRRRATNNTDAGTGNNTRWGRVYQRQASGWIARRRLAGRRWARRAEEPN